MVEKLRTLLAAPHWLAWIVRYFICWQLVGIVAVIPVFAVMLPMAKLFPGGIEVHPLAIGAATTVASLLSPVFVYLFIKHYFRLVDRRPPGELRMGLDRRTVPMALLGCVLALILLGAMVLAQWLAGWITLDLAWNRLADAPWMLVMLPALQFVGVAVSEELRYRAYAFSSGQPALPDWLVMLVIGLVWGAMHMQYEEFGLLSVANLAVLSFAYFAALRLTGSVWLGMGFHFMWDFGQVAVFGLAFSKERQALVAIEQAGPQDWVGGVALIEAGLAYTILFVLMAAIGWWLVSRGERQSKSAQQAD